MNKKNFKKLNNLKWTPGYWRINKDFMNHILETLGVVLPDDVSNKTRKVIINEMLGFKAIGGNEKKTNYNYWLKSRFFTEYYKL